MASCIFKVSLSSLLVSGFISWFYFRNVISTDKYYRVLQQHFIWRLNLSLKRQIYRSRRLQQHRARYNINCLFRSKTCASPTIVVIKTPTFFDLDRYSGVAIVYEVAKPVRDRSVWSLDNESSRGGFSRVAGGVTVASVSRSTSSGRKQKPNNERKNRRTKRQRNAGAKVGI